MSILLIIFLKPISNIIHLKNMVYDVAAFPVFSVQIAKFGLYLLDFFCSGIQFYVLLSH